MSEMAVTVREARPDEVEALHALAALTFPLACPPSTTEAAKAAFIAEYLGTARFAEHLADEDRLVLVAERAGGREAESVAESEAEHGGGRAAGVLAGYAVLVHGKPGDADAASALQGYPTAELSKLYVHPDHHGGGVARALVDAVLAAAAARGAVSVWLGVNIHNARANRFYEKCGFAIVGEKRFRVGDVVEDDWVRERPLAPPA